MNIDRYVFHGCILIVLFGYGIHTLLTPTPGYQAADVPDEVFSGERALNILETLLPDDEPHPGGSEANKKVRKRIRSWLQEQGIESEVQNAWGCHPARGRCAWVENIIVRIPGKVDGPYLALMAHYDSVAASPGAGDDVVGTAITMEIARMIKTGGTNRNPLMLIITDAEEDGLMGAEAYFTRHPLAKEIAVVLNIEGAGSEGESLLFRTSKGNASIVEAFYENSTNARGSSFLGEIFTRLPSDTDLSVPKRLGIRAADFGFAGERNHYHTINDNIANLSRITIQHHGENLYSVVKGLSHRDLNDLDDGDVIYDNAYGIFFFWPHYVDQIMLVFSLVALLFITTKMPSRSNLLWQSLFPLGLFLAITLSTAAVFLALHFIRGTTPFWPANETPYRIVLFTAPILVGLVFASRLNRKWTQLSFLVGTWWFWWSIGVLLAATVPDAAYLLCVPVLVASLLLATTNRLPERYRLWIYPLTLIMVVPSTIPKVMQLETWQGYWLILSTTPFLTLLVSSLLPFARDNWATRSKIPIAIGLIVAAGFTLVLPPFSNGRPQHMNFQLIQDADTGKAWIQYVSFYPPPDKVLDVRKFDHEEEIYPWGSRVVGDLSVASPMVLEPPFVEIEPMEEKESRRVRVKLESRRNAIRMGLVIPQNSLLESYELDGRRYPIESAWWADWQDNFVLEFRGVQNKVIEVDLNFSSTSNVKAFVFEISRNLPVEYAEEIETRNEIAVEAHDGDSFLVFRETML
ncbi:MAG: M28 family peptidase [Ignavibacteria bacterium]|nr:M28 family peptidase [Ignavibacteria bacterium]